MVQCRVLFCVSSPNSTYKQKNKGVRWFNFFCLLLFIMPLLCISLLLLPYVAWLVGRYCLIPRIVVVFCFTPTPNEMRMRVPFRPTDCLPFGALLTLSHTHTPLPDCLSFSLSPSPLCPIHPIEQFSVHVCDAHVWTLIGLGVHLFFVNMVQCSHALYLNASADESLGGETIYSSQFFFSFSVPPLALPLSISFHTHTHSCH